MIHRELESAFRTYIEGQRTGTALDGVTIRTDATATDLQWPCVIVQSSSAQLVEGGVRSASKVELDFSVISAASNGTGWQTSHKNKVAAMAKLLDDTNTNAKLAAINAATTDFTLYGWHLVEVSSQSSAAHQADTIRISAVAGDYSAGASVTGKTNATPQTYSLRHEIEQIMTANLSAHLPVGVTSGYSVYPFYSEGEAPAKRVVSACTTATRPFPQLGRWQANTTVHVVTPGSSETAHAGIVKLVQSTIRDIIRQDFTSSNITVCGLLETGHTIDRSPNHMSDILAVTLYCQQN